jgi:hypothetical protein
MALPTQGSFPARRGAHKPRAAAGPRTFRVLFERRSCEGADRAGLIAAAAAAAVALGPHSVNLTAPDVDITLQLYRSTCGVGVSARASALAGFSLDRARVLLAAGQAGEPAHAEDGAGAGAPRTAEEDEEETADETLQVDRGRGKRALRRGAAARGGSTGVAGGDERSTSMRTKRARRA